MSAIGAKLHSPRCAGMSPIDGHSDIAGPSAGLAPIEHAPLVLNCAPCLWRSPASFDRWRGRWHGGAIALADAY